ncbi:cell wall-associated NlpC family hydrolase [Pseudonocardia sediminis]|uniref:Cell wall-associated NlpC family hydrolase n=1 Tax=Pseudonocardia sediminis TaxID=1397368 RepID=A0A4Q7UU61_PSEST|nr:C40 family peptidase [Pseudonocardia sediminis]RZT85392.1 cell wall-associated NlpC family hydrolase [Pseudonocardia sediminis]
MLRSLRSVASVLAPALALALIPVTTAEASVPTSPPSSSTVVDVAVATVWTSPDSPRPVDRPALANPSDVPGWLAAMTTAQKLDLTSSNRTQTQALYGRHVEVLDRRGGWTQVAVPGQPTPKNAAGYPGWIPDAQLTDSAGFAALTADRPTAVVSAPLTWLHEDLALTRRATEVSANTRLPVLDSRDGAVLVATPSDGVRWVAASAVTVVADGEAAPSPTGADLVATARGFLGRPYLWGGRAGYGLDCSGLAGTVYGVHGITVPRDASAQATGGRTVEKNRLQPGDLLFYGRQGGKGAIHHVAMYTGDGKMIEAFDAATPVRITAARLDGEYAGARRYLP